MRLRDLNLKWKIVFGSGCSLALVVVLSVISYQSTVKLLDDNHWVTHTYEVIQQAEKIQAAAVDMETGMRGYLLAGKEQFLEPYIGGAKRFTELVTSVQKTVDDNPAQVKLLEEVRTTIEAWKRDITEPMIALRRKSQDAESMAEIVTRVGEAKGKVYFDKFRSQINTFIDREAELAHQRSAAADRTAVRTEAIIVFGTLITVGLAMLIAWLLGSTIAKPLREAVSMAETMSQGDFTRSLDDNRGDEIGVLVKALNQMAASLKGMIREITGGVDTLSSASTELGAIATQMTQGVEMTTQKAGGVAKASEAMSDSMTSVAAASEQSANNLSMVASATEEMTSTVNEIAKNSEKARSIAGDAVSKASAASVKVNDLGDSAMEISKVTEVITEISEQTNLLALNATIEAARAGEAGKGFAVVANEIKELAKQTAEATQEIKHKIEGVQGSTSETVTEIGNISQVIKSVNDIVATIATAVEEQSATTQEIATNIAQASQGNVEVNEKVGRSSSVAAEISGDITEVSASMNEMSTSSSQVNMSAQELSKLSEHLKQLAGQFKF